MKQFAIVFLLCSAAFISSCCHKKLCGGIKSVSVKFSGFSEEELDTVYRTGYTLGSGFTQVSVASEAYNASYSSVKVTGDHEWKIYVPASNKSIFINNYGYDVYTCDNGCLFRKGDQVKSITSCAVDGVVMPVDGVVITK